MADRIALPSLSRLPALVFAVGVGGLGVQDVVCRDFLAGVQPVPSWLPLRAVLAVAVGAVLIAACAGLAAGRRVPLAARTVMRVLWAWVVVIHVPLLLLDLRNGGEWTSAFEVLAIGGGAALLALPSRPALGRIAIAVSLPAFGVLHFIYRDYVASVIPAWLPGHMFWALATGVAHIAAGVALLADRKARLAAILLTVMFGTWAVILHIPRVVAHPAAGEWTSLFVCTAMCGASWLLVRTLRDGAAAAGQRSLR